MAIDIEFRQLRQFVAVARARNFTRAASELHLSQPALSRAIRKLEDALGQPVFERKPREVALTDFGESLLERASEILNLADDAFSQLAEEGRRGRVRLGAIPTIAPYFLPRLLKGFSRTHPSVSVLVQEDTTGNLIRRCSHGEIDLAILALPVNARRLKVEPLFDEELLLVIPPAHPLASRAEITPRAVAEFPFVLLDEAHCLSENVAAYCRRQSVQPVAVERISQLATVQELVALDHGVSIVPEMARRVDSSERRVYRSLSGEKPFRTVCMMWNPARHQGQWVKLLMDHLRRHSAPVPAPR